MRSWTALAAGVIGLGWAVSAAALPGWVDGKDPKHPAGEYLLGVGKGSSQKAADVDARAEIARIFESRVVAVFQDFQAVASQVNSSGRGVSVEVQKTAQYQEVTTAATLQAVEIQARANEGGAFYSLAVLSRQQCMRSLMERLEGLDGRIRAALKQASAGDELAAFKAYGRALDLMDEREGLNAMLRVCNPSGKGVQPPISLGDLAGRFEGAATSVRIGLRVDGAGAARVRDCLLEALGEKGYQISELAVDEDDADEDEEHEDGGYDALLLGRLRSQQAGEIAGSVMVRTELTLRLVNGKTKKVLRTFSGQRKEGRRDVKSSAALAAYKICQVEVPKIVQALDKGFKR